MRPPGRGPLLSTTVGAACTVLLSACATGPGAGPVAAAPPADSLPELLARSDLQRLVEAGLDRRSAPLLAALTDRDPAVRSTAARALASVQDATARPGLTALLRDTTNEVRLEAAFALGQLGDPVDGPALLQALRAEADPAVRLALMEAAGKGGDPAALAGMLAAARPDASADDRVGLALALYHFGRRGTTDADAAPLLLRLLTDEDDRVSVTAALALGAPRDGGAWGVGVDDVRRAVAEMPGRRRAAAPLLGIVGGAEEPGDLGLLRGWLVGGGPWTTRVAAARALGRHAASDSPHEAMAALQVALDDPSPHVGTTAARALVAGGRPDPAGWAAWIRAHPERPSVAAALLPGLVGSAQERLVFEWARGELGGGARPPLAWPALARIGSPEADALLVAGLGGERRDAYTAAASLAERVEGLPADAPLLDRLVPVVAGRLDAWGPHAPGSDLRGILQLVRVLAEARPEQARPLLEAAARHPHPEVRALAGRLGVAASAAAAPPRRAVDWRLLAAGGARPRLEVATAAGAFVVELHPEAAPLAVSALMSWAAAGRFDGLTFHRVEADFILQSGDIENAAGYGGPSRGLRSELSPLRYAPGVLGMASAGKDTEGSQYFITHGFSPSLDGRYGAAGRVVSGQEVADGVALGDPVLSVRPVGWTAPAPPEGR